MCPMPALAPHTLRRRAADASGAAAADGAAAIRGQPGRQHRCAVQLLLSPALLHSRCHAACTVTPAAPSRPTLPAARRRADFRGQLLALHRELVGNVMELLAVLVSKPSLWARQVRRARARAPAPT